MTASPFFDFHWFGTLTTQNALYTLLLVAAVLTFFANLRSANASAKSAGASEENALAGKRLAELQEKALEQNEAMRLQKEARERRGVLRQANLLLRLAMKNIDPFFFSFMNKYLSECVTTWERLRDLLFDHFSAVALTDDDYRALEAFWSDFGKTIGMAQEETARWEKPDRAHDYPATGDERLDYLRQLFTSTLDLLEKAVNTLGDDDVREEFGNVKRHAADFKAQMDHRLKRNDPAAVFLSDKS